MPPQHESCHDETMSSTSATMVSPSSMPSELKGTMSNANHQDSHYSPALEKDSLFVEDLRDVLLFLKVQEVTYGRRRARKLHECQRKMQKKMSRLPPFYNSWRPVMISWMYHVADMFRLMPIVVATGVYILDTCALDLCNTSSRMCNQKDLYPLMTMTALNTAVTCHETKMFPLDQLVHLMGSGGGSSADQSYTPNDITLMERRLLHRCGWKLHCPTTHDYLLRFATTLKEEYQGTVIAFAVTHLKESLLWEHMLHQEKHEEGLFSTCTLAYAAFLIAMEDAVLPLADKQAACLVLLEVSGLSAETPKLPEAYNWLYQAKLLQTNLEEGNKHNQATTTISSDKVIPAHACMEPPQQDSASDSLDDQMISDTTSSEPSVDQSEVADDHSTSIMSHDSSIFSEHSIIFFSSSSDGDAVEVVATDIISDEEEGDDDDSMDHSATASVLPTVVEDDELATFSDSAIVVAEDSEEEESEDDEDARLVLSESLDEDGFEVAFESKNINTIASLVTSPREVSITL